MDVTWDENYIKQLKNLTLEKREQYAMDLFGAEMERLDFHMYKRPLWYKLIRDEVLLAFGLVPSVAGTYEMRLGILPTFALEVPPTAESINANDPPFLFDAALIRSKMQGRAEGVPRSLCYVYPPDKPYTLELYTQIALPSFQRVIDLRSAYQEIMWLLFLCRHVKDAPPAPGVYQTLWDSLDMVLQWCFLGMYDDALSCLQRIHEKQKTFGLRAFGEYQDALERQDYGWLDTKLHENYAANLKAIKRRLKLEPDCKDTIWDRDLRHPVDVDGLIHERFKKRAIKNSEGNYTITEI